MPHSQSFDAIVLKTYDVGEADRFCILFTRENGRTAARASGARRLKSRLGGALLPFRRLTVELKEGSGGWIVVGVSRNDREDAAETLASFAALEEGIELLLRLVPDEGALPDVFDATLRFMQACRSHVPHASLGYGFALLHHLGFLPGEREIQSLAPSTTSMDHAYMQKSRANIFRSPESDCAMETLAALQTVLLQEHISIPLRAREVIKVWLMTS